MAERSIEVSNRSHRLDKTYRAVYSQTPTSRNHIKQMALLSVSRLKFYVPRLWEHFWEHFSKYTLPIKLPIKGHLTY